MTFIIGSNFLINDSSNTIYRDILRQTLLEDCLALLFTFKVVPNISRYAEDREFPINHFFRTIFNIFKEAPRDSIRESLSGRYDILPPNRHLHK